MTPKHIDKLFIKKSERTFFSKCLSENVSIEMIEKLNKDRIKHKQTLKNFNVDFDFYINRKTNNYNKAFEELNDVIQKTIILQESKKLLKSVISNKYKNLINEDTKKIFITLAEKGITKNDISKNVTNKIINFKEAEDFNFELEKTFLSEWNIDSFIKKTNDFNVDILSTENNKLLLVVNDFDSMKELGSSLWCVTRESFYFEHYTNNFNEMSVLFDFNKKEQDVSSKIALLSSAKGYVIEAYNKDDEKIDHSQFQSIDKIKPKTLENIKSNLMDDNKVGLSRIAFLEGYWKEAKELNKNPNDSFDYEMDSDRRIQILNKKIIKEQNTKYIPLIHKLKEEEIESFVDILIDDNFDKVNYGESSIETLISLLKYDNIKSIINEKIKETYKENKRYKKNEDNKNFYKSIAGSYLYSAFILDKDENIFEEIEDSIDLFFDEKIEIMAKAFSEAAKEMTEYHHFKENNGILFGYNYMKETYGNLFFKELENKDHSKIAQVFDYRKHPELLKSISDKDHYSLNHLLNSFIIHEMNSMLTRKDEAFNSTLNENTSYFLEVAINKQITLDIDFKNYLDIHNSFINGNNKAESHLKALNNYIDKSNKEIELTSFSCLDIMKPIRMIREKNKINEDFLIQKTKETIDNLPLKFSKSLYEKILEPDFSICENKKIETTLVIDLFKKELENKFKKQIFKNRKNKKSQ